VAHVCSVVGLGLSMSCFSSTSGGRCFLAAMCDRALRWAPTLEQPHGPHLLLLHGRAESDAAVGKGACDAATQPCRGAVMRCAVHCSRHEVCDGVGALHVHLSQQARARLDCAAWR
jgi:hypothetical protein